MRLSDIPLTVELAERLIQRCITKMVEGRLLVVSGAMLRARGQPLLHRQRHF